MQLKTMYIYHALEGIVLGLDFHTEYLDGMRDTMDIFLIPDFSIVLILEATLMTLRQYMALDGRVHTSYTDAAALLQKEKVAPILGWEAAANHLYQ